MIINIQDDILTLHNQGLLKKLLEDKTTKKNIMWATDAYSAFGERYFRNEEIRQELITGSNSDIIKTRARKELEHQAERTKQRAEVFTPLWICKRMNDDAERYWFEDVIDNNDDIEIKDYVETVIKDKKLFKKYIDSKRLEITCGEAPYLVSRYDVATGEMIPVEKRIGLLDRKIQAISRFAQTEEEWFSWVIRAYQSIFGYEFQGDNVLIARVNVLTSLSEHMQERWGRKPTQKELEKISNIVSWNIWQMDGLTLTIPYSEAEEHFKQLDLFGLLEDEDNPKAEQEENTQPYCRIYDWHNKKKSIEFQELKKGMHMKFDFIIGNPPYQEEVSNAEDNSSLAKQLFPSFIQESTKVATKAVSLITPARWFQGDAQDKSFLKLRDFLRNNNHVNQIIYFPNEKEVFNNVTIKGGVTIISYKHDYTGDVLFTTIEAGSEKTLARPLFEDGVDVVITDSLKISVLMKIKSITSNYLTDITKGRNAFGIIGKDSVVESVSRSEKFEGSCELRLKGDEIRYITEDVVTKNIDVFRAYKVFVSKSAGAPNKDWKIIGKAYLGGPKTACTDSLIPIGCFDNRTEAENLRKYMSTKFLRYVVSILKASQNVTQIVYRYVPLQNFRKESDIDWTLSISEIDEQLYKKYGLTSEEIDFIETHIKEME